MVQCERKEIVDFLNEKSDTVTSFVQAQEELSNVENIRFSYEEERAFIYVQFNEFLQSFSLGNLKWCFANLGMRINTETNVVGSEANREIRFEIMAFFTESVVVRRNYEVSQAESAIRLIEERAQYREDCYVIDEMFEGHVAQTSAEICKEECYDDIIHGCEFDADLSPSYGVI